MTKKRKQPTGTRTARPAPRDVTVSLNEASSLMAHKRWNQAREILEPLNQRYPRRVDVLAALLDIYQAVGDTQQLQFTCEQLLRERPEDPELLLALGGVYMANLRPALALRTFRHFLERWPDHKRARDVRKSVNSLTDKLPGILVEMGLAGEEDLELAALHEEAQSLMERGQFAAARHAAEKLSSLRPGFVPALNNLSQVYFIEGNRERAIEAAQQVLALDPANYHALSNLTRYLCLIGRVKEAGEWAARLKAIKSERMDVWVKKAEALSYLGEGFLLRPGRPAIWNLRW
jgi:tetratricopeptide (TPR) repeat protein